MSLDELVLELTNWCPLRCRHCSSSSGPGCRESLTQDAAIDLVRQGAELGASQVSFGGGEPMAATCFLPVVEHVVSFGMYAEVFTCGTTRGETGLASLPRGLVDRLASLDGVKLIFSFHGADAALHDSITAVPGSYECMLRSLDSCRQAGIHCEANFVPLRPNVGRFAELVELCAARRIGKISVLRFVPQGRGLDNRQDLELSYEEEDAFVQDLMRLRETTDLSIRTGSPFNGIVPGNAVPCRAGGQKLVVQPDGNVIPCEVYKDEARRNWWLSACAATLQGILHSPSFLKLREGLRERGSLACPVHCDLRAERNGRAAHGNRQRLAI